ncbi:hypothetical protein [Flavobacterium sp. LS1R10]|uniref:hypothetical protein n=1 Tax=Flavobacterium sp. LS1R10 TaxID=2497482 RepID=UPI000F8497CC|nr:hypothetical protein [Flavobacterium sp. LS1R10]RTY74146.1 hypothetical protein EKL96_08745 [Flavobacterium sp. LS1R10]
MWRDRSKIWLLIPNKITIGSIKKLSEKYLNADKMIYLVVGDAETQLKKLKKIGYGTPILLNTPAVNKLI